MKLTDNTRRANADRLRSYFAQDGALTGLRSVHGPLVDMALAGVGSGAREQERGVNGLRFTEYRKNKEGLTVPHSGLVAEHRAIHAAYAALTIGHQTILAAAYGNQRRWHPQTRKDLAEALPACYRDAFGACILHPRIQRGMRDPKELTHDIDDCEETANLTASAQRKKRARSVTGIVVWLPGSKAFKRVNGAPSEIDVIAQETALKLEAAHHALADRLGILRTKKRAAPKRKPREPTIIERVYPMEAP